MLILVIVLFLTNLQCFLLMGWDKRCAARGKWRISEKTLFLSAACFGGLGGVLGMRVFRHKTKHWYFQLFFPLMFVVQTALVCAALARCM